jgi:hypothetical protein
MSQSPDPDYILIVLEPLDYESKPKPPPKHPIARATIATVVLTALVIAVNGFLLMLVAKGSPNDWAGGWADVGVLWVFAPVANIVLALFGLIVLPVLRAYSDDRSMNLHVAAAIGLPILAYAFDFIFIVSGVWK